jgi:preprotein translocase subunit YajC
VASPYLLLAQAQGQGWTTVGFFVLIFAIMYFVMIRPQQKQLKAQRDMIGGLKKGDEVITQGGLLGKVHLVADKTVTLEVANNVRIRILKTSIQGKVAGLEEAEEAKDVKDAKKEEK